MKISKSNTVISMTVIAMFLVFSFTTMAGSSKSNIKSDIVDTAIKAGSFNTLVAAVKAAGLVDTLKGDGPFTVFAPTDKAFASLPKGTVTNLLKPENRDMLTAILTYHVVPGRLTKEQVVQRNAAKTVNGQQLDIKLSDGSVMIDQAHVTATDIHCSNGVIHVVDQVMIPSSNDIVATASAAGYFKTLLAAAKAAGLVETLQGTGPFTVFAPTDSAFEKLPEGTIQSLLMPENKAQLVAVLKYHVVSGRVFGDEALKAGHAKTVQGEALRFITANGTLQINNAQLVAGDIDAANGVIHVIDTVLLPPKTQAMKTTPDQSVIELAIHSDVTIYNAEPANTCSANNKEE